jgi:hypothetical protein
MMSLLRNYDSSWKLRDERALLSSPRLAVHSSTDDSRFACKALGFSGSWAQFSLFSFLVGLYPVHWLIAL